MPVFFDQLVYATLGKLALESNSAVDSLFLFMGRPFDSDTELQNNLNRWYDASVGRWLSEDPIGFAGGVAHSCCSRVFSLPKCSSSTPTWAFSCGDGGASFSREIRWTVWSNLPSSVATRAGRFS
jgi:RHS repeat-associated protein